MRTHILVPLLLSAALAGCHTESVIGPIPVPPDGLRASDTAVAPYGTIQLTSTMVQNLMPPARDNAGYAVMDISMRGGDPVPTSLRLTRAWITNGSDVWSGVPEYDASHSSMNVRSTILRGVPLWKGAQRVDVIVAFEGGGTRGYLRVHDCTVRAVY